jgi:hypothetical protein
VLDAVHDVGAANQYLLLLPFVAWFVGFYLRGFEPALDGLRKSGVLAVDRERFDRLKAEAAKPFSHRLLVVIPIAVGFAVTLVGAKLFWFAGLNTWNSPMSGAQYSAMTYVTAVPVYLLYHLLAALVSRMVVTSWALRRCLSVGVRSHALHPDGCGGFALLGGFALRVIPAGIAAGLASLVGVWATVRLYGFAIFSVPNCLIIGAYLVGLSIAFFMPLLPARRKMSKAKRRTLLHISRHLQQSLRHALANLSQGESERDMRHIDSLHKLYALADAMPVYPFNSANLVQFATSVLWPIALMLIQFALDKLT